MTKKYEAKKIRFHHAGCGSDLKKRENNVVEDKIHLKHLLGKLYKSSDTRQGGQERREKSRKQCILVQSGSREATKME